MKFDDLNLSRPLLEALAENGFEEPTAIQRKVFSPIMSGGDVIGIAQTGTGKTFAYLLPLLRLWRFSNEKAPSILIMVPTRELVAQVVEQIEMLTTFMSIRVTGVYGGTNIRTQIDRVLSGLDIIVGTPGRLLDLMLKGALKTKAIKRLVIDEVDEMLNLGFRTQLNNIVEFLPTKRQNLMFSATMPPEVEKVVKNYTTFFKKIETAPSGAPLENIEQFSYEAKNFNTKANLLKLLLDSNLDMTKVLVFVSSKKKADALFEIMNTHYEDELGVIHSSKSQNNRFKTVNSFQDGTYRFIIATDVIARGLDISGISHVINFDLTSVAESYIHRIGRTGRATEKGIAISFISPEEKSWMQNIEQLMAIDVPILASPEGLMVSDELIDLEIEVEYVPFNNHKVKRRKPSGPAFHEKKEKNKKVNRKKDYEAQMKKKYKKQYRSKKSR